MQKLIVIVAFMAFACNNDNPAESQASAAQAPATAPADSNAAFTVSTDPAKVAEGKKLFAAKTCSACHQMNAKVIGPPLAGVTQRRSPEWLGNMIMKPDQFVKTDPEAKKLFEEYKTPMPNVGLTVDETNAILAYLASQG